jgi:hypothetical protein
MANGTLDWPAQLSRERSNKTQLAAESQNAEEMRFRALELIEWANAGLRPEPQPILAQEFEGKVIEADEHFVTVAFDMDNRKERRRFSRSQLQAAPLRLNDIVELHCKLTRALPRPPLTPSEVEEWEKLHPDLEAAQAKTEQAKSLLQN